MSFDESEAGPPTLVSISLDLQITICTLLDPSDILALRATCKTLQLPTRQRVVWLDALHRVCIDNSLFLPSFPIHEMSDVELEHATMAPRRWIELCAAFERQHPHDSAAELRPRTTRIIEHSLGAADGPELFIVPGGRYMVSYSRNGIFVWDLGYASSADCKLIASGGPKGKAYTCKVQATSDGMGLVILYFRPYERCFVYEIYPQSETPQLTQIAHLGIDPARYPRAYLLPETVVWSGFYEDRIVFRVWDYRANHSIGFSADVDVKKFKYNLEVIATKREIFVLCEEEILVWAIPPLSPQPSDFFDYNPTHIRPLLRIAFPDGIVSQAELVAWQTMSHWYFGSSQPIYFDALCWDSKLLRFEIFVKPNVFDTSLRLINTELVPHSSNNVKFETYRVCEDTLVACWNSDYSSQFGAYTGLTSSRFTAAISRGGPAVKMLLPRAAAGYGFSLCPASGRCVHLDDDIYHGIVLVDFF